MKSLNTLYCVMALNRSAGTRRCCMKKAMSNEFYIKLQLMTLSKNSNVLIGTPFFVVIALVFLWAIYPLTGIGPANNTFAFLALVAIATGLLTGIISLFRAKHIWIGWRILIGLLYIPTVMVSLLMAGF